jgi:hypothetical protein
MPFSYKGNIPFVVFYMNVTGRFNASVNATSILSQLLTTQPDIVADALKAHFPANYKTVHVIDENKPNAAKDPPYGSTPKQGEYIVVFQEGEIPGGTSQLQQLQFRLSVNPDPRFPLSNSSKDQIGQFEKARSNFTHRLKENIAKALPNFSKDYLTKLLAENREGLEKTLQQAKDEATDAQKQLLASTGMPAEKISEQLAEISRQQIAAKLSLVGMDAREKAIADQIAKTQAKMQQQTDSDETIKNLEQLLQLRTERLENLKKMSDLKVAPATDVQSAEADVLSAKIELDKTRAAFRRANGGEQLDAWNNELSHIAIDRAETEARLKYLSQVSSQTEQQLRDRRDAERKAEEARPKLAEAEKQIADLSHQLDRVKKEQEDIQPLRVVLPDEPGDKTDSATPADANPAKADSNSGKIEN